MNQIRKKFTNEKIKVFLMGYRRGILDRPVIEDTMGRVGKFPFLSFKRIPPKSR